MARLNIAMSFLSGPAVKGLKDVDRAATKTTGIVGKLGGALIALGAISIAKNLAADIVRVSSEFEQLRAQLKTVTGSVKDAQSAFAFLLKFAKDTPFEIQEITKAFIQMKARGLEPTAENLTRVGNLAAAMGRDILTAQNAITQAMFGETESIKQFGIQIRQFTDTATVKYKDSQITIEKSSKAIRDAIFGIIDSNFGDGMADQMETFNGAVSNASDAWEQLLDEIGNGTGLLSGVLTKAVEGVTALIENLTAVTKGLGTAFKITIKQNLDAFINFWDSIRPFFDAIPGYGKNVETMDRIVSKMAQGSLGLTLDITKALKPAADDAFGAMADGPSKAARSIPPLEDRLKAVLEVLKRIKENLDFIQDRARDALRAVGELPTGGGLLAGGMPLIDVDETKKAIDETGALMVQMWREQALFAKANFEATLLGLASVLAQAIRQGLQSGFDRQLLDQVITQVGMQFGAGVGAGIGFVLGGPVGAQIGEMFGAVIGEALGDVLGDIISGIGDSGPQVGTGTIGPGGSSVTTSFQFEGIVEAMDHMQEILRQVNQLVGGGIELTQQIAIHLDDTGAIWVDILNLQGEIIGSLGTFETLAEAAEAGLVHLLNTANLSEDMRLVYQELIRNAEDMQKLFTDLRFIGGINREIEKMGGPAMRAAAALRDGIGQFKQMEAQIRSLGLSTAAMTPLLEKLARAQAAYMREMKVGVLTQLAALAEQFGVSSKLIIRARILETKLQFFMLRAQLKVLGLWEKHADLWRELFRLAKQEARRAGEGFASGSGTFRDFGSGTGTVLHGTEQVVTAKEGTSIAGMVANAIRGGSGGAPMLAEMRGLRSDNRELITLLRRQQQAGPFAMRDLLLKGSA